MSVPSQTRVLLLTGYGGYKKLKVVQQEIPQLEETDVVVNIRACGLNFAELVGTQGLYDGHPKAPCVMGFEGAGTIVSVGAKVSTVKVGDRVICMDRHGMWKEHVTIAENKCFLMPEDMTFEEGATIPVNYLTAYLLLFEMGHLRPGASVLCHMAAGGVGCAVAQLCRTVKNVTLFGTASAGKHEFIRSNGVTHPIDYRTMDYAVEVKKLAPKGVDIVLDPLLGKDGMKGYNLLKPLGRLIQFGAANMLSGEGRSLIQIAKTWWNTSNYSPFSLLASNKMVGGFHAGHLWSEEELIRDTMVQLIDLYKQGAIKPVIHASYHFEQVGKAMSDISERRNIGKVILLPGAPPTIPEEETTTSSSQEVNKIPPAAAAAETEVPATGEGDPAPDELSETMNMAQLKAKDESN